MKKCLVPISVGNPVFRTSRFEPLLESIPQAYDEVVFFVADFLQLYNHAMVVSSGPELARLLHQFRTEQDHLNQRKIWLMKLRKSMRCELARLPWRYLGASELEDRDLSDVWRSVLVMYECVAEFRDDIDRAVLNGAPRRGVVGNDLSRRLSRMYLLEEVSMNIRLRVKERIEDEYYAGSTLVPLVKLYAGDYGVRVSDLVGVDTSGITFRFYEPTTSDLDSPGWRQL